NGGSAVTFQYDDDGLLTQAGALTLARNTQTGMVSGTTLNGVTDSLSYDAFGDLATYQAVFNATTLFDLVDTRDALGRLVQRVETIQGVSHTLDYAYDPAGRLTQVKRDNVVVATYGYEANGNRLSFTGPGGGTVNGTYDPQDRLTQYGTKTYTYAAGGELRTRTDAAGTTTYDHDAQGVLRGVTLSDGTRIDYVIDGAGRRVGKKVNGTLTQ